MPFAGSSGGSCRWRARCAPSLGRDPLLPGSHPRAIASSRGFIPTVGCPSPNLARFTLCPRGAPVNSLPNVDPPCLGWDGCKIRCSIFFGHQQRAVFLCCTFLCGYSFRGAARAVYAAICCARTQPPYQRACPGCLSLLTGPAPCPRTSSRCHRRGRGRSTSSPCWCFRCPHFVEACSRSCLGSLCQTPWPWSLRLAA